MFEGLFSTTIWLNVTSIFALLYAIFLCSKSDNNLIRGSNITPIPFVIVLLSIIYIGTRPLWCYSDSWLYSTMFNLVKSGVWPKIPGDEGESFWFYIEYLCIDLTDASGWFIVITTVYILGMCIAAYRWLPKHFMLAIVFMFTALSFWSFATNGLRNGMATSIAMFGLSFFCRTKKELIIGYALLVLASMTHKSCMLTIAASTAALFFRNTKINISIWLFCIVLGLILQEQFKELFSWMIDDGRMAGYLNAEVNEDIFSKTGFRWDFLLYSSLPIIIGWFVISKKKIKDKTYGFILHTYIFSNAFWVLINTAAYSNRFAYLSWFLYPIVLIYPFCKFKFLKNQSIVLGLLLIIMTAFTYIMS